MIKVTGCHVTITTKQPALRKEYLVGIEIVVLEIHRRDFVGEGLTSLSTALNLLKQKLVADKYVMSSAEEDLESEGLITAEENAGQLVSQTAESPPDSPPPLPRVKDKL